MKRSEHESANTRALRITLIAAFICIAVALIYVMATLRSKSQHPDSVPLITPLPIESPEATPSSTPMLIGSSSRFTYRQDEEVVVEPAATLITASVMLTPLHDPDTTSDYSQLINDTAMDAVSYVESVFTVANDVIYTGDYRVDVHTSADVNAPVINRLGYNCSYTRIALSDTGWSMIDGEYGIGYVETSRVSTIKPIGQTATPVPAPTLLPGMQDNTPRPTPTADVSATPGIGNTPAATTAPERTPPQHKIYNSAGLYLIDEVRGIKVYMDDGVSPRFVQQYIEDIKELPAKLANPSSIAAVNITSENLKTMFPSLSHIDTRIIGVTSTGTRTIWINGNLYAKSTILHESIHVWDTITNGGLSRTDEFKKIYEKEKHAVSVSRGNNQNAMEFLASAGEMYYSRASRLKQVAPETFAFLRERLR